MGKRKKSSRKPMGKKRVGSHTERIAIALSHVSYND